MVRPTREFHCKWAQYRPAKGVVADCQVYIRVADNKIDHGARLGFRNRVGTGTALQPFDAPTGRKIPVEVHIVEEFGILDYETVVIFNPAFRQQAVIHPALLIRGALLHQSRIQPADFPIPVWVFNPHLQDMSILVNIFNMQPIIGFRIGVLAHG